jgi:flagellin-like hook-associated protein FlgL
LSRAKDRAKNALRDVHQQLAASQLRLATGKHIAEASDDPAGYSMSLHKQSPGNNVPGL